MVDNISKTQKELSKIFEKTMAMMGEPVCHDCKRIVDAERSTEALKHGYVVDRPRDAYGNYFGFDLFWLCPKCALKRYPVLKEEGYEKFLKEQ